jgi:hypothetical protein
MACSWRASAVCLAAGVARFVNSLASGEMLQFDLSGENLQLITIEQRKQGNASQDIWITGH